jgi:hypothetical protein
MTNVHILADKIATFKSKNAIMKFKKAVKNLEDIKNMDVLKPEDYLKEGFVFKFDQEGEDIKVQVFKPETSKKNQELMKKLGEKRKQQQDKRTGKKYREMKEVKNNVDKTLFKQYQKLMQYGGNLPIKRPDELLNDVENNKQMIEMFGKGVIKTNNKSLDKLIMDYHKKIADKVGIKINKELDQSEQTEQTDPSGEETKETIPEEDDEDYETDSEEEEVSKDFSIPEELKEVEEK